MKVAQWFGVLAALGAFAVSAAPASALTCWNPSEATNDSPAAPSDYLDCYGANGLHAQARSDVSGINHSINVTLLSGDLANAWGYDSHRNYIGCFAQSTTVNHTTAATCSGYPVYVQLEAWDN